MNKNFSSKPLVSVIINCFNGEKYLKKTIDSVIAQTYENWEIIFWDNQSTDQSAKIFKNYEDSRLKYFYAPHHSKILYEAKNYALKKINGDFIAFLDTDDWWLPNKLEKQIPLFEDPEVGMVYGNYFYYYEKINKTKIFRKKKLPTGYIIKKILSDYIVGSATYVIRKKSMKNLDYQFDKKFHIIGDFDMNIKIAASCKVDCVQNPVAFMRIHGKNESILNKNLEVEEMKTWYNKMKKDKNFAVHLELDNVKKRYLYLEAVETILNYNFIKGFYKVLEYPLSFTKLKLLIILLLPKLIVRKIKNY
jgi:glycosyltransferase involved in cell wall biosynthesis